jgi:hypothetical protein
MIFLVESLRSGTISRVSVESLLAAREVAMKAIAAFRIGVLAGLVWGLAGCSASESGRVSGQLTDEQIRNRIPGVWVIDEHAEPGEKLGDGKTREIEFWTFRPDGSWSAHTANNNPNLLLTMFYGIVQTGMEGKWWVNDGSLYVDVESARNPVADIALRGKTITVRSGRVYIIDGQEIKLDGCTYIRQR